MKKRIQSTIVCLSLLVTFGLTQVQAGIGVSPAEIINDHLKPGGTITQQITLSQSEPNEDIKVTITTDVGDANDWFSFKPGKEFTIPAGQSQFPIEVVINVPSDASLDQFKGAVRFTAVPADQERVGGVSIAKGGRLDVDLITTNKDVGDLLVRLIDIQDLDEGDSLNVDMKIENKGNVTDAPDKVTLEILDLNQNPLESLEATEFDTIEPSETKTIQAKFYPTVGIGEFFGIVKVYYNDEVLREERLVFNINKKIEAKDTKEESESVLSNDLLLPIGLVVLLLVIMIAGGVAYKYKDKLLKNGSKKTKRKQK